jgi:hypothetical protein
MFFTRFIIERTIMDPKAKDVWDEIVADEAKHDSAWREKAKTCRGTDWEFIFVDPVDQEEVQDGLLSTTDR